LLWPKAEEQSFNTLEAMLALRALDYFRVQAPQVLAAHKQKELVENFRYLDPEGNGRIQHEVLVSSGLADDKLANHLREAYDRTGDGFLCCEEFLEMLCPLGLCPQDSSRRALNAEGHALVLVAASARISPSLSFEGWLLAEDVKTVLPRVLPSLAVLVAGEDLSDCDPREAIKRAKDAIRGAEDQSPASSFSSSWSKVSAEC